MSVYTSTSHLVGEATSRQANRRGHELALDHQQKRACLEKCSGKENNDRIVYDKLQLLANNHTRQPLSNTTTTSSCRTTTTTQQQQQQQQQPPAAARSYVDIDAASDTSDPMSCAEYAQEIFANLRHSETLRRPSTTYMESLQSDINPAMRAILVDWLVEVGLEYRLASDTLFLSVAYIDRFLSLMDVPRSKLQLVGVTAMLIASKYEEIYAPQVDEFCYITDNTYPREEVLAMEKDVLDGLDFDLTQPTTKTFLRRFISAAAGEIDVTVTFEFLCSYLAELSLMEYSLLSYLPSHVAASCVLLALFYLGKPTWSNTLWQYSGYSPAELRHCTQALHGLFLGARTSALPASRDKYSGSKFGAVSALGVAETLPESLFQEVWY